MSPYLTGKSINRPPLINPMRHGDRVQMMCRSCEETSGPQPHQGSVRGRLAPRSATVRGEPALRRRRRMSQTYRTLRVASAGQGVLSVVLDAPPMNLIGPELVRDLVHLF